MTEPVAAAERDPARAVLHGGIVLLLGLLAGIPYSQAIVGHWGDDAVRAWRVAHDGLTTGGVGSLAVVALLIAGAWRASR